MSVETAHLITRASRLAFADRNQYVGDSDFVDVPVDGEPIANRVQPNKRPRSSMAPTIVFDADGAVEIVTGSPGGSRIIGYTAQSIINMIDFGMDPQEAINTPHVLNRDGSTEVEAAIRVSPGPMTPQHSSLVWKRWGTG